MKSNRKIAFVVMCFLLLSILAGCSSSLGNEAVTSVRYRINGNTVSIGDSREAVEKTIGKDVMLEGYYEEDGVWRITYWDAEGVNIDYLDDRVVAIRINDTERWEIAGGARIGLTRENINGLYKDSPYKEPGASGGILFAYDDEMNPIEFSIEAPYIVTISFENDIVSYMSIQYNF